MVSQWNIVDDSGVSLNHGQIATDFTSDESGSSFVKKF